MRVMELRDLFEDMVRAIELHEVRPQVDERIYAFDQVAEALRELPEGRHFGKICVEF